MLLKDPYPIVKICPGCTTPFCTSRHTSAPVSLSENVYVLCTSATLTCTLFDQIGTLNLSASVQMFIHTWALTVLKTATRQITVAR